ncbi:unnamed protein product [Cyprideis torosa]|uniref:Uncharacterized protein n=1 Tax=Cyprideis torosa TaxID=163714 RepID=A0A7R8WG38_9CRUS|nr:unnamed protein product [Cyprideis torosa]CAG0896124.1 unnamed protein product [Cyprideis torosa]
MADVSHAHSKPATKDKFKQKEDGDSIEESHGKKKACDKKPANGAGKSATASGDKKHGRKAEEKHEPPKKAGTRGKAK